MSLHRPAVQVNDFHPFAALNKRSERHITPNVRNGRMGLIVLTAVGLSVVFNALLRRPLPKTINDEWKEAERKRNAIIMDTPIAKHEVGAKVTIPKEFHKLVKAKAAAFDKKEL